MFVGLYLLIGLLLAILLVKSASWMIVSSSHLAKHFNISEYTISFLVIAFATSLPEVIVGVVSALDKNPVLSYGNVLGSNIVDLTLILATPIFIGGALSTREIIKNKDLFYTAFFGLLPVVLIYDGKLSRSDALVLLAGYILYLFLVLRRSSPVETLIEKLHHIQLIKEFAIFIGASVLLLVSANFLVKIAENLSITAQVPLIFVGLTVTALGTSLPELIFGLKAVTTNHSGEVLGNVVGSVVANSTLVLGITALIEPITKSSNSGIVSLGFLMFTLILFVVFSLTGRQLGKKEALLLIMVYIVFIMTERFFV